VKYRNNLTDTHDKAAFAVVHPFDVYVRVGHTDESNTYMGASMMLGNVYQRRTLRRHDHLLDLPGGVFILGHDGTLTLVTDHVPDRHPFEKNYGGNVAYYPTEKLHQLAVVPKGIARAVELRFSWKLLLASGRKPLGLDFVLEPRDVFDGLLA
jgi:hypothetical protein